MDLITTTPSTLATIDEPSLSRNPAAVYLAGLSGDGQRTQKQALEKIALILTGSPDVLACNWAALRYQHTQVIRAKLAGQYAPRTANRILSALRRVLEEAWRLGLMNAEEYHRARDIKNVIGETVPAGRELAPGEIAGLLQACEKDTTAAGARDAAIIAIAYACGLRRAEIAGLLHENYDPETGRLVLTGKRNKERTAYLVGGAYQAMADWLNIRGDEPGALFWPINKGGKLQRRAMTTQAIYNLLQKRAGEAGVKSFSPHDMRRTFVSDLLDAGADIATVAKMAGHASVTTTARYDRRPEQAKQKAAGLLHVPYRGR